MTKNKEKASQLKKRIIEILKKHITKAEFSGMTGFGVIADQILQLFEAEKKETKKGTYLYVKRTDGGEGMKRIRIKNN